MPDTVLSGLQFWKEGEGGGERQNGRGRKGEEGRREGRGRKEGEGRVPVTLDRLQCGRHSHHSYW